MVVVGGERVDWFRQNSQKFSFSKPIEFVEGGGTRSESVRNGFQAVTATMEIVAVHDAARPLVSVEEIGRTVEKAGEIGAACLVAQVTDTIKELNGANVTLTVDRKSLR